MNSIKFTAVKLEGHPREMSSQQRFAAAEPGGNAYGVVSRQCKAIMGRKPSQRAVVLHIRRYSMKR